MYTQSNGNEQYGIQRAVFDNKYKFVFNGFDYDELYNLEEDPEERVNLLKLSPHDELVQYYYKKLWSFAYENKDSIVDPYILTALASYGPGIIF